MTNTKSLLLAVAAAAMAFTVSCSLDEGEGGVSVGNQKWTAQNSNSDVEGSVCYENDPANCEKYGRLYNWEAAKKACEKGWHLPTLEEWETLMESVGGQGTGGRELKAKDGWNDNYGTSGNGEDKYGFAALPGGYQQPEGGFYDAGYQGIWWTASELGGSEAYTCSMNSDSPYASLYSVDKSNLRSVRCVKD